MSNKKDKVKKDSRVIVISGAHKDKVGKVLQVQTNLNRVIIENVNLRKKHEPKTQDNPDGAIIEREMPIHISNVMLEDRRKKRPNILTHQSAGQ
jgi:large subunit ribosomal protein L24